MRLFVTGFGAFGGVVENPSGWLAGQLGLPHEVLPVTFAAVDDLLLRWDREAYDGLLCLGVAAGAPRMRLELMGRNWTGPHPGVDGEARPGPIDPEGPALRASTLWTLEVVDRASEPGRLGVSVDAGDYLCNYLLTRALTVLPGHRVGFIHVVDEGSMPLDEQLGVVQEVVSMLKNPGG